MKMFSLVLLFFCMTANAEPEKGKCNSFFDGLDKPPYSKNEMIEIIKKDKYKREYLRLMKAEIVDVQDTGERFRCNCYHYLVKYKGKDGTVWIDPVEIKNGEVESPTAKSETRSVAPTR